MSLQPSSAPPAMQPAASTASAQVPRLPADLILAVIKSCEHLETQRESTLAALCLLSRQYTSAAQRSLYSHLDLDRALRAVDFGLDFDLDYFDPGFDLAGMAKKTSLETLIKKPELRPYVKRVSARRVSEEFERAGARAVFEDLPNVDSLAGTANPEILHRILRQTGVRLKNFEIFAWDDTSAQLVDDHRDAFEALKSLRFHWFSLGPPSNLEHVETLTILHGIDVPELFAFTASFRHALKRLDLGVLPHLHELDINHYPRLDQFNIIFPELDDLSGTEAAHDVVACLGSASALSSLGLWDAMSGEARVEFEFGQHFEQMYGPMRHLLHAAVQHRGQSSSSDLLRALPASLEHLTIVADDFPVHLLASYLAGPSRPPSLATLSIGGELGRKLRDSVNRARAACATSPFRTSLYGTQISTLAGVLERAGIELMTAQRGVW
ncbi:hypothetical protein JCM9279_001394 [Rhodotorula babjevae]